MKKILKDYLTICADDKRAFIAIICLTVVFCFIPAIYSQLAAPVPFDFSPYQEDIARLEVKEQQYVPKWKETKEDQTARLAQAELFAFNPNDLDYEMGIRLGLPRKVASNIEKYLAKNGRFRKKADLRRIYGMSDEDYARVEAYISLPEHTPKYGKGKGQYASKKARTTKQQVEAFKPKSKAIVLKAFNPNELTKAEAMAMGMSNRVAQTFINFRDKIGGFKTKAQIQKVYGLGDLYTELEPFIELPKEATPKTNPTFAEKATKEHKTDNSTYTKQKSAYADFKIDINTRDTVEWKKLRGIGVVFASRIVKFQKLLGGFTSKAQLMEVYGMDEERFAQIESHLVNEQQQGVQQLSLNDATLDELKKHPYIDYKLAKGIVKVKEKYGFYTNTKGILDFDLVDETKYQQLKPYLTAKRITEEVVGVD